MELMAHTCEAYTADEGLDFNVQSYALMIQHTFKRLKTIKSPTACFTVRIIRGKLPYSNRIPLMILTVKQAVGDFKVFKLLKVC